VSLKPGPNTVQFQAKDDAGNTSALASINVSYVVASTLDLGDIKPRNVSSFYAVDSLVIFSSDHAIEAAAASGKTLARDHSRLRIVDFANPAKPNFWPEAALPGRLENIITEFDLSAGLLFASSTSDWMDLLFY